MSATIAAIAKKIIIFLATDKRTWKAIGLILGIIIAILLLPVMLLLAVGSQFSGTDVQQIDYSQYVQTLSAEQKEQLSQTESDGKTIETELTELGLKKQIVKAQMIYLTYFDSVQKGENFFADYCACFKESNNQTLIDALNQKYGLHIDYSEFMRSYAVISNVSIDENLFVNLSVKNNIDLARWAENAYETQWGYVPHSDGNVLSAELYRELQKQYPDEITVECDKWQSRRTVDNFGLLQSYLCYDAESREIAAENYNKSAQDLYNSAAVKGDISTLPDTIGTALIGGDSIGIFVGDGKIVYAKSIADGVVKETVSDGNWSAWFEISDVQYGEEKSFSTDIQFEEYDPAVKNNLDLVQWAIQAHENGWGYVYGTYGNVLTESLLQDRASVFGSQVTSYMDFIRSNWMGKRTSDCVGLIKGYGWYDSASGEIVVGSNGMMDVTANGMFEAATVKGTIDTIPEVPGLAVWHQGHIGIYIGNGEVIEAMNTTRGVTRTKLAGRSWTHWLQIPYISYVQEEENTTENEGENQ